MIDVRPLEVTDFERVLTMWEALLHNGHDADRRFAPAVDPRGTFRPIVRDQWLVRRPFAQCLVAWVDDAPAGFVAGFPVRLVPVLTQPPTARISDMWVEPARRRLGVGEALVQDFARRAHAAGFDDVEVGTLALDDRAMAFWRAQGFGDWQVTLRR